MSKTEIVTVHAPLGDAEVIAIPDQNEDGAYVIVRPRANDNDTIVLTTVYLDPRYGSISSHGFMPQMSIQLYAAPGVALSVERLRELLAILESGHKW